MKTDFADLIESGAGGVFRCHRLLPLAPLESVARGNLMIVQVRLHATRDKNAFLNATAKALKYPDYYGHHWDAFYDCLRDLKRNAGAGLLLVLRDASGFARADPEEFAAAVDTLADAADDWQGENQSLVVIVELAAPVLASELPEINCPMA